MVQIFLFVLTCICFTVLSIDCSGSGVILVAEPKTYYDAYSYCLDTYGTYIASIYEPEIPEMISLMSDAGIFDKAWIGLINTEFGGWFEWLDDSCCDNVYGSCTDGSAWSEGHPLPNCDKHIGTHYVNIDYKGYLNNDLDGDELLPFFCNCEKELDICGDTTTTFIPETTITSGPHTSYPSSQPSSPGIIEDEKVYQVFLTFDDGPRRGTDKVLKVLKAFEVKATFFVIGDHTGVWIEDEITKVKTWKKSQLYRGYVESIINDGHLLANHAYSHKLLYGNPQFMVNDFEKNAGGGTNNKFTFFKDLQGKNDITTKCRLPGRNTWRIKKKIGKDFIKTDAHNGFDSTKTADLLANKGYNIYGWDVEWKEPNDDKKPPVVLENAKTFAQKIINALLKQKENKIIVLVHDPHFRFKKKNIYINDGKLEALITALKGNKEKLKITFHTLRDYNL